jgi:transposase
MTKGQREVLEKLARSQSSGHREVTRAKVLLLAADGAASTAIAWELGISPTSVTSWRVRFTEEGLKEFGKVKPGRGRKPSIPDDKVAAIVAATLHEKPPGTTQWSCRTMAKAYGVSPATVQRVWAARGLKPAHLFKASPGRDVLRPHP